MTTRSVTFLFERYREEARLLHQVSPSSVQRNSLKISRTGKLVPEWLQLYETLVRDVSEIGECLKTLEASYTRRLLPGFGEKLHSDLEREIKRASQHLTTLLHDVEKSVRKVYDGRQTYSDIEGCIRRNIQKRFASQLQWSSSEFRSKQESYLRDLRGQKATLAVGMGSDKRGMLKEEPYHEVDFGHQFELNEAQALLVSQAQASAGERVLEVEKIAKSVADLTTIVKDIGVLVVDQGTLMDRIDYNISEVQVNVRGAVRELRVADRRQRRRHAFWCIVCLSIGCGVMSLLLVLKWIG